MLKEEEIKGKRTELKKAENPVDFVVFLNIRSLPFLSNKDLKIHVRKRSNLYKPSGKRQKTASFLFLKEPSGTLARYAFLEKLPHISPFHKAPRFSKAEGPKLSSGEIHRLSKSLTALHPLFPPPFKE